MVAIPDTPPDDSWFGNKNRDTPIDMIKAPRMVPAISRLVFFRLNFSSICIKNHLYFSIGKIRVIYAL